MSQTGELVLANLFDPTEDLTEWLDDVFSQEHGGLTLDDAEKCDKSGAIANSGASKCGHDDDFNSSPKTRPSDLDSVDNKRKIPTTSSDDSVSEELGRKKRRVSNCIEELGNFAALGLDSDSLGDTSSKSAHPDEMFSSMEVLDFLTGASAPDGKPSSTVSLDEQEQFHACVQSLSPDEMTASLAVQHDNCALSLAMERTKHSRKLVQAYAKRNQASERTKQSRKLVKASTNKGLLKSFSMSKAQNEKLALARAMERSKQSRKIIQSCESKGYVKSTLDSVMLLTSRTRKMLQTVYVDTLKVNTL